MFKNKIVLVACLLATLIYVPSFSLFSQSLDLGPLSLGNSKTHNGLRINIRDNGVEYVNGVNITFLKAKQPVESNIKGLSIGLPIHYSGNSTGINLAVFGTVSEYSMKGLNIGGLAAVSGENMNGIALGGLATIAGEHISGFSLSGLASIGGESMKGVHISGLATIAGEEQKGLAVGGLAAVAGENGRGALFSLLAAVGGENYYGFLFGGLAAVVGEDMKGAMVSPAFAVSGENHSGIKVAGLFGVAGEDFKGFEMSGIGNIAGERSKGIHLSGIMNVAGESLEGLSFAGAMNVSESISGFSFAAANIGLNMKGMHVGLLNLTDDEEGDFSGFGLGASNWVRNHQSGITVGIFNYTKKLGSKGLQLGVLNINRSNPRGLRVLPFFNKAF